MARYHAAVRGNRGPASRCGSKHSGIKATVNGWDTGVEVEIHYENERDVVYIYRTLGTNGDGRTLVAKFDNGSETATTSIRADVAVGTITYPPIRARLASSPLRRTR